MTAGPTVRAQDLEDVLGDVGEEYARSYVEPLVNSFGVGINTGFFHTGPFMDNGNGINVFAGVRMMGIWLPSSDESFDLSYASPVYIDYTYDGVTFSGNVPATISVENAPTFFGEKTKAVALAHVDYDTTIIYEGQPFPLSIDTTFALETIGGLFKTSIAPLAVPQIELGSFLGTDVMVRWLPVIDVPNYGSVRVFGAAVRHTPSEFLQTLPVDVSIYGAWQTLLARDDNDDDVARMNSVAVGATVSTNLDPVTLYAGIQVERSELEVDYVYTPPAIGGVDDSGEPVPISFDLVGKNRARFTAGASVTLGVFHFALDLGISRQTVVSSGIGVVF